MKHTKPCIPIALLAFFLASGTAAAKSKTVKAKKEEPPASSSWMGGSEGKRARSRAWVAAGYGNVMGGINGPDVEGAAVLGPSMQAGGGFATGSMDLGTASDTSTIKISNEKLQGTLVFGRFRYFVGNTFNLSGVVSYRIITATADFAATDGSGELDLEMKSTSITVGLTIGNHWAFDNGLTLGADWIGYHVPVTSGATSSTTTKGILANGETGLADEVQSAGETIGKTAHSQLLVATIGFLF